MIQVPLVLACPTGRVEGTEDLISPQAPGLDGVRAKRAGALELPRSGWMAGWEGLLVCELNSSVAVTLNFTPNHTWISGFPSILPGLSRVSGKAGLGLAFVFFLLNTPFHSPCSCLLPAIHFRSRIGRWEENHITNLSSKVPARFPGTPTFT